MENYLRRFRLYNEKETPELVYEGVSKAVPFRGTNLWILIFAIFIASLGLNVGSIAVVIGAMLISPLMGPIVGLGYSAAINDSALLRKSLTNYLFALMVGLLASTLYFLLSPIKEPNAELYSRTQPNIYDVLIALFGGFAGILAVCSKQKGNVVPGVAIATALMPPLCTAGYGLALLDPVYLFGALYLFLINSVFIAFATFVTTRYLRYPFKEFQNTKEKGKSQRIIAVVVILTAIPSIYFGWDIVQRNRFETSATQFVQNETQIDDHDLWKHTINAKKRIIELIYIGEKISDSTKAVLESRLVNIYKIEDVELRVNQGLSSLNNKKEEIVDDSKITIEKNKYDQLLFVMDSMKREERLSESLYAQLEAIDTNLSSAYIHKANKYTDSTIENNMYLVFLNYKMALKSEDKDRIIRFLDNHFGEAKFEVVFR